MSLLSSIVDTIMSGQALWLVLMMVFIAVEITTVSLTSIWFALGCLAALISSLFGAPLWLQIAWCLGVSILTLIFTKPLAQKYLNSKTQPTNADMVIGATCVVLEPISNLSETGTVKVDGKVWTARSEDGTVFAPGERVKAVRIEGVKLIVAPAQKS